MGSIQSGDDMVVGQGNLAQDSTVILASERIHFGGDTVFAVGAIPGKISAPFTPTLRPPSAKLHAIVGRGTNRGAVSSASIGQTKTTIFRRLSGLEFMEKETVQASWEKAACTGQASKASAGFPVAVTAP